VEEATWCDDLGDEFLCDTQGCHFRLDQNQWAGRKPLIGGGSRENLQDPAQGVQGETRQEQGVVVPAESGIWSVEETSARLDGDGLIG